MFIYNSQNEDLKCQIKEKDNEIKSLEKLCENFSKRLEKSRQDELPCFQRSSTELRDCQQQLECSALKIDSLESQLTEHKNQEKILESHIQKQDCEINEYKKKNCNFLTIVFFCFKLYNANIFTGELHGRIRYLSSELIKNKNDAQQTAAKLSCLDTSSQIQSKQLIEANKKIKSLQEHFCELQKNEDNHNVEVKNTDYII